MMMSAEEIIKIKTKLKACIDQLSDNDMLSILDDLRMKNPVSRYGMISPNFSDKISMPGWMILKTDVLCHRESFGAG